MKVTHADYAKALAKLANGCSLRTKEERKGAVFAGTHKRLDDEDDSTCHAVEVIASYVEQLEDAVEEKLEEVGAKVEAKIEKLEDAVKEKVKPVMKDITTRIEKAKSLTGMDRVRAMNAANTAAYDIVNEDESNAALKITRAELDAAREALSDEDKGNIATCTVCKK